MRGAEQKIFLVDGKKPCTVCGDNLPALMFYKDKRKPTGLTYECKQCAAKRMKKRTPETLRRYHEKTIENAKLKHNGKWYRQWCASGPRKTLLNKARDAVKYAIKAGRLTRGPCVICGEPKAQGHHTDYRKLLDVMWLCRKHHLAWHRVFVADNIGEELKK